MTRFFHTRSAGYVSLVALTGLFLTGCRSGGHWGEIEEVHRFEAQNDVKQFEFKVVEATKWTELGLALEADAGTVTCTFTDPSGRVRWEEQVAPGRALRNSREFEPIEGQWQLRLAMHDASGSYTINWSAR